MATEISTVERKCELCCHMAPNVYPSFRILFRILITLVHFSAIIPVHLFCLYANMTAVSYTVCFVTSWRLWAQTHPTRQGQKFCHNCCFVQEPPCWCNWSEHVEGSPVFWFSVAVDKPRASQTWCSLPPSYMSRLSSLTKNRLYYNQKNF